jgi:thiol-disulfide isomerase/thioredoxin
MITSFLYISIIAFFLNGCNKTSPHNTMIKKQNLQSIEANLETIKKYQETGETFLLMFYADWCGHCKNTKPAYQTASNDTEIPFLLLNSETDGANEFMAQEKVGGYPTIKKYKGTELLEDYRGDRSVENFIAFSKSE